MATEDDDDDDDDDDILLGFGYIADVIMIVKHLGERLKYTKTRRYAAHSGARTPCANWHAGFTRSPTGAT